MLSKGITSENNRNYGIDLLRIICMIMIVFMHLISHSDLIDSIGFLSFKYEAIRLVGSSFMICAATSSAVLFKIFRKASTLSLKRAVILSSALFA